ncbi:hypothetical protein ASPCADRAFT_2175 [Aspergillus carbonarius ITEM 5010]|uniref:Fungal N-terminal domain-containing protein n=1 Tax=Aspergillus carbonarius (strain ITEM 5010) TaxID=602072 RepID=A0A1R3RW82_ASPC5|nr:hypothetical protein ASPCADRAFT_2175 [Aspergillus carbonarius ITEM 5010]
MTEAFTIIGLVGNIISFVDYAYKAILETKKACGSAKRMTLEVSGIDYIVRGIQQRSKHLLAHSSTKHFSKEELVITKTQAACCLDLAEELKALLDKLSIRQDAPRPIEITRVALQWQRKKGQIESLERRLCKLDDQARSGKSTLMKYASKCPRTLASLQKWANGDSLITASFFFWNQGLAETACDGLKNAWYEASCILIDYEATPLDK